MYVYNLSIFFSVNKEKTGNFCAVSEGHLIGVKISKNGHNPIDVNHFANINVKKYPRIGVLDPPRPL